MDASLHLISLLGRHPRRPIGPCSSTVAPTQKMGVRHGIKINPDCIGKRFLELSGVRLATALTPDLRPDGPRPSS